MNDPASDAGDFQGGLERVREDRQAAVRDVLTDGPILAACEDAAAKSRDRVLGPVATVLRMIVPAVSAHASDRAADPFRAAWNEFGGERVSSTALSGRHGHRAVELDATCLSMEDNQ